MSQTTFQCGAIVRAIDIKGNFFIGVYMGPLKQLGHFVRNAKGQKIFCKKNHVAIAEPEEVTSYVRDLTSVYKSKETKTAAQVDSMPLAAQNAEDL